MKAIFANDIRSFMIKKLKNSNNEYISKIKLSDINNNIIIPLSTSTDEVISGSMALFGNMYNKYIKQYYFPKKWLYTRTLIKGPVTKMILPKKAIVSTVNTRMPKVKFVDNKILTTKTTILDLSSIFEKLLTTDKIISNNPKFVNYIENIVPEMLMNMIVGISKPEDCKYTSGVKLTAMSPITNMTTHGFKKIIVPVKVTESSMQFFSLQSLNGEIKTSLRLKKSPETMYLYSLIKFLFCGLKPTYSNNSIYGNWVTALKSIDIAFFFYNDNYGFVYDKGNLFLENGQQKIKTRLDRLFHKALTILIKNNANELKNSDLDNLIVDEVEDNSNNVAADISGNDKKIANILSNMLKTDAMGFKNDFLNSSNSKGLNESAYMLSLKAKYDAHDNEDDNEYFDDEDDDEVNDSEAVDKLIDKYNKKHESSGKSSTTDDIDDPDDDLNDDLDSESDSEGVEIEVDTDLVEPENIDTEAEKPNLKKEDEVEEDEGTDIADTDEVDEDIVSKLKDNTKKTVLLVAEKNQKPKRSPAQERRLKLVESKYKSVSIDGAGRTVEEMINDVEATTIVKSPNIDVKIRDDSYKNHNLADFTNSYVAKTMEKDMVSMLKSFSENKELPMHILKIDSRDTSDKFTEKKTYTITFEDDTQKRHTLKFDYPLIDKDGRMRVGGNTKILKKQIINLPIIKTGPDTVLIVSQYNKSFIKRHPGALNIYSNIVKNILHDAVEKFPEDVIPQRGNTSSINRDYITNLEYDDLGQNYTALKFFPASKTKRIEFYFVQSVLRDIIKVKFPLHKFRDNYLPIGIDYANKKVIEVNLESEKETESVSYIIYDVLEKSNLLSQLNPERFMKKIPKRRVYSKVTVGCKDVPLIIFLSTLYGLTHVISAMGIETELSPKYKYAPDKMCIRFKDYYLYYNAFPSTKSMLLNGLVNLSTEDYNLAEMDTIIPYGEYCYNKFSTRALHKNWFNFYELFLDPITLEVLRDLSLPTDFLELFLYANDLLGDTNFQDESDITTYRLRSHEMINELLYKQLAKQYKDLKAKRNPAKMQFSIPQEAILSALQESTMLVNADIVNPLQEYLELGTCNYKGTSGLSSDTGQMLKRSFNDKNLGIISISAPDNATAGMNKYITWDPNVVSTRGYMRGPETKAEANATPAAKVLNIAEAVTPGTFHDDPKRISYTTGQTKHVVAISGSDIPIVTTGAEKVIAYRATSSFVKRSESDGVVNAIDEKTNKVFIEYKDGSKDVISYADTLNRNSDHFYENKFVLDVKVGQKIKKNDVIAYNKNFFKKDLAGDITYAQSVIMSVAINESHYTIDDSSLITQKLAEKLSTPVVKSKRVVIPPTANLISYRKVGDHIRINDVMLTYDNSTDQTASRILDTFGELDESFYNELMNNRVKSNYTGIIVEMNVYWACCKDEDMSPSVLAFIEEYKKKITKGVNANEKYSGKVDRNKYKLDISIPNKGMVMGERVPEEGAIIIEYFIKHDIPMGVGDKMAFHASLKSIVADVVPEGLEPLTESGMVLDGVIGSISIANRMIASIYSTGTLSKILHDCSKEWSKEFLKGISEK